MVFQQQDWRNFMVPKALGKGNIFYTRKLFQGDQYDVLDDGDGFMNIYIYMKTFQIVHLEYVQLLYVNYTSHFTLKIKRQIQMINV